MFDPDENADYAARFLKSLYSEYGEWSQAAGAYHSRTPSYAKAYATRFDKMRNRLNVIDPATERAIARGPGPRPGPRKGSSSLVAQPLTRGGQIRLGSLVPINSSPAAGRALIDFE